MNNIFLNNLILNLDVAKIDFGDLFLTLLVHTIITILLFGLFCYGIIIVQRFLLSLKNINYVKKVIINLFVGILISLISPILLSIKQYVNNDYVLLSQIIAITILSFFISTFCMVGAFPVFLISTLLMVKDINGYYIIVLIIFYAFSVIWVFVNRFLLSQKTRYIMITSFLMFGLLILVSLIFFNGPIFIEYLFNYIGNFVLFYLIYAIGLYINNFINNAYNLKSTIMYDGEYFANSGFSEKAFNSYVAKNNVQTGLMITFDILQIENLLRKEGKEAVNNLETTFIKYIFQIMGKECFYFKTKDNKYSLFKPIDKKLITLNISYQNNKNKVRNQKDFLKYYEEILANFPKVVDFNNKKYNIQLVAFCSIYGVHSNSFNELVKFNNLTKNNWSINKDINLIKLYKYNKSINNFNEYNKYLTINKKYELDKINISLIEDKVLFNTKHKYVDCYLPKISWVKENIYSFETLLEKYQDNNDLDYILRNICYRSIKLFSKAKNFEGYKNQKLLLLYPYQYLISNDFNLINFRQKLNTFDIETNSVVICFDQFKLTNKDEFKNINELSETGINFGYYKNKVKDLNKIVKVDYLI